MTWKLSDNYRLPAELGWKEALRHLLLVLSLGQAVLPGHVQQGLIICSFKYQFWLELVKVLPGYVHQGLVIYYCTYSLDLVASQSQS